MCLTPVYMYDTGLLTASGKRKLTAKYSDLFRNVPPIPVPCGKCPACLERKRSEWVKRMCLESCLWPVNSFVTLTYDDIHLPPDGLASKRDIQKFLKRVRQVPRDYSISIPRFKYFIVCEYGKLHHRPHYHGVFFGLDFLSDPWRPRLVGVDRYSRITSDVLSSVWSNGYVLVDRASPGAIRYVSKYITKSDDDTWSLKSIGLAKSIYVHGDSLSSMAYNDTISLPSAHGFVSVRRPRFLDRYLEQYDPSELKRQKENRRYFCLNASSLVDLALERERITINHTRENDKRKLDNET